MDSEGIDVTSTPKLPAGHPFAKALPPGMSPFDVAEQVIAFRSGWSGGMHMMADPDDEDDEDDEDGDTDPDTVIRVDGKEFRVGDLQRITTREKKQGKRAGVKEALEKLGFGTLEEAEAFISEHRETAGGGNAGGNGGGNETGGAEDDEVKRLRAAAERDRRAAAEDRRKQAAAARRGDLRGALRAAGVDREDLDDAYALLDPRVDAEYDDDDIDDAIERLQRRHSHLFGATRDDGDDREPLVKRKPAGRIPAGKPPRKPTGKPIEFGAEGKRRAAARGWIKSDQSA